MKYTITESKIKNTITNYIMESFPMVGDVKYLKQTVVLGSTPGSPIIDQTIIRVIFNNQNNEYQRQDLIKIRNEIISKVDGLFGLDSESYGTEWSWDFRQIALVSLDATLTNMKR
jgi:hypothetical protein